MTMRALLVLASVILATEAEAIDGVSLSKGATITRIGVQWDWPEGWRLSERWRLGGFWDVEAGVWKDGKEIVDLSATPVFRLKPASGNLYFEGAIGFHMLSKTEIGGQRLGSSFQFGDHVGAGWDFGHYDATLLFQHHSNGGIKKPNFGYNVVLVRLRYRFRKRALRGSFFIFYCPIFFCVLESLYVKEARLPAKLFWKYLWKVKIN